MSCGSTACTQYDTPASKPLAGLKWLWQARSVWLAKISRGRERWHQRRQLLELDDRLLADIGLSREQAADEAGKSFWIRVTMWRVYR
jgi:uncharacterized protein YjiS (DUF1127 family)